MESLLIIPVADQNEEYRVELNRQIEKIESHSEHDEIILSQVRECITTFQEAGIGIDETASGIIKEKLLSLSSLTLSEESTTTRMDTKNIELQNSGDEQALQSKSRESSGKTIRIAENMLDKFFKHVGELLEMEELFRSLSRRMTANDRNSSITQSMHSSVSQFERISKELRSCVMEVRKVDGAVLLKKVPRIVRDVARQKGKAVKLVTEGDHVLVDKSYVDLLDSPLTHMVRNSVDHGIELPEIRKQRGKNEEGTVTIVLEESEKFITLSVQDDGSGLDLNQLREKALSLDMVQPDQQLSESQIIDILFTSGVSTATEITDISGRGVGMDVVKRSIESAGGTISVENKPGQGCVFTIYLPRNVSTQIIDGYGVRSFSGEEYILPLDSVEEAFSYSAADVSDVVGKGKVVRRRNSVIPVFVLDNVLHGSTGNESSQSGLFVLLRINKKSFCLHVSDVVGIQKVVRKEISGVENEGSIFDGAAITSSEKLSLVLNTENLARELLE